MTRVSKNWEIKFQHAEHKQIFEQIKKDGFVRVRVDNEVRELTENIELGDIVVSVMTAQHQAKQMNHDLIMELRWLVSHGLLHLLGWNLKVMSSSCIILSCFIIAFIAQ